MSLSQKDTLQHVRRYTWRSMIIPCSLKQSAVGKLYSAGRGGGGSENVRKPSRWLNIHLIWGTYGNSVDSSDAAKRGV